MMCMATDGATSSIWPTSSGPDGRGNTFRRFNTDRSGPTTRTPTFNLGNWFFSLMNSDIETDGAWLASLRQFQAATALCARVR